MSYLYTTKRYEVRRINLLTNKKYMTHIITSLLSNEEARENSLPEFQRDTKTLTPWLD